MAMAACGDDTAAPPESFVEAVYGPAIETQLVPFPSNRYTILDLDTRTGLRVDISTETTGDAFVGGYPLVTERLSAMDGFSTVGGFAMGLSAAIDGSMFSGKQGGVAFEKLDPAAFAVKGSPLLLVDVDPDSPEKGRAIGLLPRYFEQAKDDYYTIDEFTVVARPAEPLAPARRYAFFGTSALLDTKGNSVHRSALFDDLVEKGGGEYEDSVLEALAVLEDSLGVQRDDVVVASVFTTASVHDEMVALADAARAAEPPALVEPFAVQQTGDGDDRLRFRATFETPEYRRDADGVFEIEDGVPVAQSVPDIELYLAFSDATFSGPRPIVIYQHGLGGDKDGSWGTSDRLAEVALGGVAVIAIDSPEHGSRGNASGDVAASVFGFFGIDNDTGEFDIGRARDNFRQMAADQLELVRLIGTLGELDLLPEGAPDGVPDLDVSQILYIGHSFGSVQGPTIFALAPEIKHTVWNVGGDGLMFLLEDSATFSLVVNGLRPPGTADGSLARFMSLAQAIVDPGDPLNYAHYALIEPLTSQPGFGARSVLLQEVVGDTIVPNSSSNAVARAARLGLMHEVIAVPGLEPAAAPATANGPNGSTAIICQFDKMNGNVVANHGELIFAPEAQQQYVEFFKTGLADGVATVIEP